MIGEKLVALLCFPDDLCSVALPHGVVGWSACSVSLWYFLIILTHFFVKNLYVLNNLANTCLYGHLFVLSILQCMITLIIKKVNLIFCVQKEC